MQPETYEMDRCKSLAPSTDELFKPPHPDDSSLRRLPKSSCCGLNKRRLWFLILSAGIIVTFIAAIVGAAVGVRNSERKICSKAMKTALPSATTPYKVLPASEVNVLAMPSCDNTTYSDKLGIFKYQLECGMQYTHTLEPALRIAAYSVEDCMDACSSYHSEKRRQFNCVGVSWSVEMAKNKGMNCNLFSTSHPTRSKKANELFVSAARCATHGCHETLLKDTTSASKLWRELDATLGILSPGLVPSSRG